MDLAFFRPFKDVTVKDLAHACGFRVVGEDHDFVISDVATLKSATKLDLSFFSNRKYLDDLNNTNAGVVIISEDDAHYLPHKISGLVCKNAMFGYAKALMYLESKDKPVAKISPTARIHPTASIGHNCSIGEFVVIESGVIIGDNCTIGHGCMISKSCKIGCNCTIGTNVSISYSIIGESAIINSGARIGESGFGIIPTGTGMMHIRQLGRVIIGDRVRIGANTTIDRGSIEDTTIGNDTIIDNLVQIAHNVTVGNRCILVSQVGIAGSSSIGDDVVLAGQVGISGHVTIGDKVVVAAKSGVASSVGSGKTVGGIPAVDASIWRRQVAFLKMSVTKKRDNS